MSNDALPYAKPLPVLEGLSGEFYAWCRQGELRFQRCTDCGTFRHVPRELCAQCNSFAWEWARSSGRGTVYTWTVVQRALHPAFANDTPLQLDGSSISLRGSLKLIVIAPCTHWKPPP